MKKIVAMILALCLCFITVPSVGADTAEVRYSTDDGATWTVGSLKDASIVTQAGNNVKIELLKDIALDSAWGMGYIGYNGNTIEVDGKGFTIKRNPGVATLFLLRNGCNATFKNITIDGGAVWSSDDPATRTNSGINAPVSLFAVYQDSTLILEAGTVLQNNDGREAVGLGTYGGSGKLIMKDGAVIKNNTGDNGAVMVYGGTFEMHGGEICGNYNPDNGAAVYIEISESFIMKNGKIYNNVSKGYGGGVASHGTFDMSGGEIYGNISESMGGGVISLDTFNMSGGKIFDNEAAYGGGVLNYFGTFNFTGGEIFNNNATYGGVCLNYGSMNVSGNGNIYGNTKNGTEPSNVYISSVASIIITGELKNTHKIGVSATSKKIFTNGWGVYMKDKNPNEYFSADVPGYFIKYDQNTEEVMHSKGVIVAFDANGGEGDMPAQTFEKDVKGNLNSASFTKEGYRFLGWATTANGEKVYDNCAETAFSEDTTLYAVWGKIESGNTEQNKPSAEKDTEVIVIDIKENYEDEESEENPNTGAPAFFS